MSSQSALTKSLCIRFDCQLSNRFAVCSATPSRICCLTFMHFSGRRLAFLTEWLSIKAVRILHLPRPPKPVPASTELNHHRPSNGGNSIFCAIHSPFFSCSHSILTSLLFIASLSIGAGLIRAVRQRWTTRFANRERLHAAPSRDE